MQQAPHKPSSKNGHLEAVGELKEVPTRLVDRKPAAGPSTAEMDAYKALCDPRIEHFCQKKRRPGAPQIGQTGLQYCCRGKTDVPERQSR